MHVHTTLRRYRSARKMADTPHHFRHSRPTKFGIPRPQPHAMSPLEAAPMSSPTIAPPERDPTEVAPTGSYHKADPVWVYRGGWHAGVIEAASDRAVTVRYRPGSQRGTGVDTFTAAYVSRRAVQDPTLDLPGTLGNRTALADPA
jgi:hypothetical protein